MNVYDIVIKQITDKLKAGVVPWKQTWKPGQKPANYISGKAYRGINIILLSGNPYTSPYYLSFKQIQSRGGHIKQGETGHPVVFYKPINEIQDEQERKSYMVMRFYLVWNIQQTTLELDDRCPETETDIPSCDELIASMPDKPQIDHGLSNPCYIPTEDRILLPPPSEFYSGEEYYAALFHELVHATGHVKRLSRFAIDSISRFGSETYTEEELVAEVGATFLCGQSGILTTTIDNNAAYIQGWLQAIKANNKLFLRAVSAAQKAVDYITGEQSPFFLAMSYTLTRLLQPHMKMVVKYADRYGREYLFLVARQSITTLFGPFISFNYPLYDNPKE